MDCPSCGAKSQFGNVCSDCGISVHPPVGSIQDPAPAPESENLELTDESEDETTVQRSGPDSESDHGQTNDFTAVQAKGSGCGIFAWIAFAIATAFLTWLWNNPWLSAILTLFLALTATQYIRYPWVRNIISLALSVTAFFFVTQWSQQDFRVVTGTSVGPYSLGQTVSDLTALGVPDVKADSSVTIPDYERVYAEIDSSGVVVKLTIDSTGDDGSPPWSTVEGISAESSIEEFSEVYPSATVYRGSWTMAWAAIQGGAIMLTKFGPDQGLLEIGRVMDINRKFREETAPLPEASGNSSIQDSSGYGRDEAYADILNSCLNEVQSTNGEISDQDRQFCNSWAQSNADKYCTEDSCEAPPQ